MPGSQEPPSPSSAWLPHDNQKTLLLAHLLGDESGAARLLLEEGLDHSRNDGANRDIATALYCLGVMAEDRGDHARSIAHLSQAAARFRQGSDRRGEAFAWLHLGVVASGQEDFAAALVHTERGLALAQEARSDVGAFLGSLTMAHVATLQCEFARAADWYHQLLSELDARGTFSAPWEWRNPEVLSRLLPDIGELALRTGYAEEAVRLFAAGATFGEAIGLRLALPESRSHERAQRDAEQALGKHGYAAAWQAGTAMTADQVRSTIDLVLAGKLTPSGDRRHLTALSPLTAREHDVLRLLAEGRTNAEIGDTLFISPGTAKTHVARILGKLGARTRTEAVGIARRDGLI